MDFESALKAHKNEAPPHVQRVLGMRNGHRKDRILARMERDTRSHLDIGEDEPVDWANPPNIDHATGKRLAGSFDWSKIFALLETLLKFLLPLLGL